MMKPVTKERVREMIASILVRYSPKAVARAVESSERNVYNWRSEISEPSAYQLIRLMGEFDAVYEAVICMAGRADTGTLSRDQRDTIAEALRLVAQFSESEKEEGNQNECQDPSQSALVRLGGAASPSSARREAPSCQWGSSTWSTHANAFSRA